MPKHHVTVRTGYGQLKRITIWGSRNALDASKQAERSYRGSAAVSVDPTDHTFMPPQESQPIKETVIPELPPIPQPALPPADSETSEIADGGVAEDKAEET